MITIPTSLLLSTSFSFFAYYIKIRSVLTNIMRCNVRFRTFGRSFKIASGAARPRPADREGGRARGANCRLHAATYLNRQICLHCRQICLHCRQIVLLPGQICLCRQNLSTVEKYCLCIRQICPRLRQICLFRKKPVYYRKKMSIDQANLSIYQADLSASENICLHQTKIIHSLGKSVYFLGRSA